ncbi:MAG: PD-(D/E)XK nuclease family protein, partial [Calditrichaeota bacterium]
HHPSSSTTEEKIQEFTTYVSQFLTTSPSEHSSLPTSRIPAHLQPVQSIPEGIVFSATQLAVFHEDPRKYFQRYHLGFFESDYEFIHPIGEADQLHLLKGKLVHAVLENGLPQSVADIAFRLDHAFHRYEVFDPKMKSDLEEEITGMLATFIKSEAAREIFENPLAKTEIPITMRLGKDYFTGTLDRVFKNSEGLWEVVDYKTNKVSASQVENEGKKYTLQLEGYGLLLANLFPEQSEYPVTLYFLHPGAHYRRVFQPADIEAIREKFLSLIREIRTLYPLGDKIL